MAGPQCREERFIMNIEGLLDKKLRSLPKGRPQNIN